MDVIQSIAGAGRRLPKGYSKIGDDVAVVPLGAGKLVVKVDMLVEHTDVPPGMTYRQAARKAVAMCVSDFAAKGAKPDSFMVSVGLRGGVTQEEVDELALGFRDAAREWRLHLVGGDTNEARELVIDCAMVGFAEGIVDRKGARPGDILAVTGPFGYPPAGLRIMKHGAASGIGFGKKAKASVLKPSPSLEVGWALAPYMSSSMDSSDGLARSVHTLASESGVGFELTKLPMGDGVEAFAAANGLRAENLVLEGGEEYLIVGTVRKSKFAAATAAAKKAGGQLIEIGRATSRSGRVELKAGGRTRVVRNVGWTHLG